jgi:two-component system, LytTR family, response regulator
MKEITCVIVEDEPLALERAKDYVKKLPFLKLQSTFDNGIDAMLYLKSNEVDLIFLDINLGDFSGIQLLESSKIKSQVVMTTAYHEYALKGFELNVSDYLLKPYTLERFIQAVEKVQNNLLKIDKPLDQSFIFVKTEYRLEKIQLNEVLYIEGMRDYRRIHTTQKKIMTLQTFKEFEQIIFPNLICRVQKSYMVAINRIESIEKDEIKIQDKYIPISDSYKKMFFDLINRTK